MVYDFGLDDRRLFHALAMAGASGGMLEVHCENAVMLEELTARHLEAGETAPRFHATSRPPYVEAEATVRAIAYARAADAPLYVVHLSCDEALDAVRAGRAEGLPVFAETCPHYLTLDDSRYDAAAGGGGQVRHLAAAPGAGPMATRCGPGWPMARSRSWPRTTCPTGSASRSSPGASRSIASPTAVPASRRSWRSSTRRAWRAAASASSGWWTCSLRHLRGSSACATRAPWRSGGTPTSSSSIPRHRRVIRQADLHHTSDFTPYEGREVVGAVRSVAVRGWWVVRDGAFVGRRGFGRFVERQLERLI